MGDCSAARGSEIILRVYELEIYNDLAKHKLLKYVSRYLRFRDDVSVHIHGDASTILNVMKIIVTGYPKEIQFNVESRLVFGKFLNISIFNYPVVNYPITSVLRKPNSKYDVIPFHSNVNNRYKRMAGLQYFKTNKTHTYV